MVNRRTIYKVISCFIAFSFYHRVNKAGEGLSVLFMLFYSNCQQLRMSVPLPRGRSETSWEKSIKEEALIIILSLSSVTQGVKLFRGQRNSRTEALIMRAF